MKKIIETTLAPAPVGPYSQAIMASGNFMFISGQIGLRPDGTFAGEDIESQTDQACRNIGEILKAADLSLANVVKTTIYLKNMTDFAAVNAVYATFFNDSKPARAALESPNLPKGSLIEIEAIAVF